MLTPRLRLAVLALASVLVLSFGSRAAIAEDEVAGEGEPAAAEVADEPSPAEETTPDAAAEHVEGGETAAALDPAQLREMVEIARAKVLDKLLTKIETKSDSRMESIGDLIGYFSFAGLLLLFMPLVLRKKYPGQGKALFKYSALAAFTFVLTVNLFGMVVMTFRVVQSALGSVTNPQLQIADSFFDVLDENAEDLVMVGTELFGPTLEQLSGDGEDTPVVLLIENGKKIIEDADVFVSIANGFKKLDFLFGILPTVLLLVTLVLFVLAIKPTLLEIVRLPIEAAQGRATSGKAVLKRALRRVGGELLATLCTLIVLIALTLLAGAILTRVVGPALDALIGYFTLGVIYLQHVEGASSGLVFLMLFSVVLFLVLNLAAVIAAMTFFLAKSQKIFQRRFNDRVRLREHVRFFKWGVPSLLLAQLVPWGYLVAAEWGIDKLNGKLADGVSGPEDMPWAAIMLAGPFVLVFGFALVFWAVRGFKALGFLATYKVPVPPS